MSETYDFSHAKRGAVLPSTGKSRITIYLDDLVIERFKALSEQTGKGYQALINEALRAQPRNRCTASYCGGCASDYS